MIMANKNARCWYMLKDVEFRIVLPQEDNFGGNENNASRDASAESNRVAMFVKTMSHNMPNIMTVKVHGANNEPIAQTLGSELAKVYASQLQLLSSTVSLLATKTLHCPKLTHLELDLNSDAMAFLPEICAGSLVSLKLNSVPYDFSWRRFQNKGAEGDIVFGRLRQLQVSFDLATRYGANSESSRWRYNSNGRDMYVVRFPVLEKLFVFNLDDGSDLLYMDELPLVLKTLTLVNSYVFTKNISRIKLQSVDALNVGFLPLNNAQEFYEMTNKLFNESIACRHAGMRLLDLGFELDPCKIEWHNLSQLAMFGTTNIDNLSRLLSRLPKLKRVYIDQVVATEGTREDIQDPSSYDKDTAMLETEREYQVAITTKITALVLRRMGNGAVPDLVADKIEKLLMHTHLLKSLSCPRVVNERLENEGERKPVTAAELRKLRDELNRISARALERADNLERICGGYAKGMTSSEITASGQIKRASDSRSQSASAAAHLVDSTQTPSTGHPASKRVKSNQGAGSRAVNASDSEQSTKAGGSSSVIGGNGKHFQAPSPAENSPLAGPATPAQPKVRHSAGTPVQDDFSRVKVTNQVQIQTYWSSLDPYFRNITDEDIIFLESPQDNPESYVVPKLGKFYAQTWAEEEVSHFPDHMHSSKTRYTTKHLLSADSKSKSVIPDTSFAGANLVDSDLALNTARLGPLTERIISALVAERFILKMPEGMKQDDYNISDSESDGGIDTRQMSSSGNSVSLEDRLKRELRYIGILDDEDIDWNDRQDDEVCVALRALQRQLREQVRINAERKDRLLSIAKEHIGYQEYIQVIDELDKQVEQSYLKRHRLTKSRKRKSTPVKTVALSDNALNAIDRRKRVINAIGHLFPSEKFDLPEESIFKDIPKNPDIDLKQ
ncbi:Transcriptional regulator [Coemansia sp. Benny D115]|nr:Transcriptional regulator [Coemansia sp. Benny D115]